MLWVKVLLSCGMVMMNIAQNKWSKCGIVDEVP